MEILLIELCVTADTIDKTDDSCYHETVTRR